MIKRRGVDGFIGSLVLCGNLFHFKCGRPFSFLQKRYVGKLVAYLKAILHCKMKNMPRLIGQVEVIKNMHETVGVQMVLSLYKQKVVNIKATKK